MVLISGYDGAPVPLSDPSLILKSRLRLEGFIVSEHMEVWPEALKELGMLVATGKLKYRETIAPRIEDAPEAFLECSTAQLRLGPVWSPRLTLLVLRDGEEEIALNGLLQAARAHGDYDFFRWTIDSRSPQARLHGRIEAPAAAFVGLNYLNPPGGSKTCLNSKLASAEFTLERPGRPAKTFVTRSRAAFEILTDRSDHGVRIAA